MLCEITTLWVTKLILRSFFVKITKQFLTLYANKNYHKNVYYNEV